ESRLVPVGAKPASQLPSASVSLRARDRPHVPTQRAPSRSAPTRARRCVVNTRMRLPHRRANESFDLEVAGQRYTATIGRHTNGAIGEIFLQAHKPGSQSDANARDAAVAASLAIQFGCPLETLRHALLRDSHGQPSTPLGAAIDQLQALDSDG